MIIPQMNANKRARAKRQMPLEYKRFLSFTSKCSGVRTLLCISKVDFAKNNNNYSRSFAFICGK